MSIKLFHLEVQGRPDLAPTKVSRYLVELTQILTQYVTIMQIVNFRSCQIFQEFSNSLAHIVKYHTKQELDWYLDDYFFANLLADNCNWQVTVFLNICKEINFPVSEDKTIWATQNMTFLGLLLNTLLQVVSIPEDKRVKAQDALDRVLRARKVKVHDLQKLTGQLNFLSRAIVPGRAFTRRMYAKYNAMNQFHHIRVDKELRLDCNLWSIFLQNPINTSRSFLDFADGTTTVLDLTSDASLNCKLGFAGVFKRQARTSSPTVISWFAQKWPRGFIQTSNCSIEVAELIGSAMAVAIWIEELANRRVTIWCDNQSVVHMINKTSSSCKKCMYLIRYLTLLCMKYGVRLFCRYISTKANRPSDLLSRMKQKQFLELEPEITDQFPTPLSTDLWPLPACLWEPTTPY